MLYEIDEAGNKWEAKELPYRDEFEREVWNQLDQQQRNAIAQAINQRLDQLVAEENASGQGALTNTSLEGGRPNPFTGEPGNWQGTPFQALYDQLMDERRAALAYGNAWKMVIIARSERWIGIRADPTFPQRGITLNGKSYFLVHEGERQRGPA